MNRRQLLLRALQLSVLAPLGWIASSVLAPELFRERRLKKIAVGPSAELFAQKNYVLVKVGETPAIVFRRDNVLEALSLECTHAACTLRYDDASTEFICPCHGGVFHADGSVKAEPPRKPLHRLFVSEHDGIVYLSERVIA